MQAYNTQGGQLHEGTVCNDFADYNREHSDSRRFQAVQNADQRGWCCVKSPFLLVGVFIFPVTIPMENKINAKSAFFIFSFFITIACVRKNAKSQYLSP